jgi:hypothetical protein
MTRAISVIRSLKHPIIVEEKAVADLALVGAVPPSDRGIEVAVIVPG